MMPKEIKKILLAMAIAWAIIPSLKAQGNLTFVGPVHYISNFEAPYTNVSGPVRIPIDTIVVPTGHVLKLENDAISQTSYNGPLILAGQNHTIIGAVDLLSPTSNNAAILSVYHYYTDQRQKNYPMWIGAGTHYLYFTNSKQSQYLARYSLHGLMFRVQ
jgi:hypothetical protein